MWQHPAPGGGTAAPRSGMLTPDRPDGPLCPLPPAPPPLPPLALDRQRDPGSTPRDQRSQEPPARPLSAPQGGVYSRGGWKRPRSLEEAHSAGQGCRAPGCLSARASVGSTARDTPTPAAASPGHTFIDRNTWWDFRDPGDLHTTPAARSDPPALGSTYPSTVCSPAMAPPHFLCPSRI